MTDRVIALASAGIPGSLRDVDALRDAPNDGTIPYRIACSCGGTHGLVTSQYDDAIDFWLDPIVFTCADCGRSAALFDSAKDGYDAALNGGGTYTQRSGGEHVPCPECGELRHQVVVSYRYDLEEDELEELTKDVPLPNLFTGIGFKLTCSACGTDSWLGDFECA